MKRRLFSVLLALTLTLSLFPTAALAAGTEEQYSTLTPGGTYWFDLSGVDIPGDKNISLPDSTLHYVPFTFAGTVNAYVLKSVSAGVQEASEQAAAATNSDAGFGYTYDHSLFIADDNVVTTVMWEELRSRQLIFGTNYKSGGVEYTLRAPSAGSSSGNSNGGAPENNEWDAILNKDENSIKNWNNLYSWGQDTDAADSSRVARRGGIPPRQYSSTPRTIFESENGFRPVLELPASDALGPGALKTVYLNLKGGSVGEVDGPLNLVYTAGNLIAPSAEGLTRPVGNKGTYFKWRNPATGRLYAPGEKVPDGVPWLDAQWSIPEQYHTLTPGGTYWFDLSGVDIPGEKNIRLPDSTLHYVPFTYTGTVNAYVLKPASSGQAEASAAAAETTSSDAVYGYTYDHSLFIADHNVTTQFGSWDDLKAKGLIFGKDYLNSGVNYTLRALSVGNYDSDVSTDKLEPLNNEWDTILDKSDYIKNWSDIRSVGQDTYFDNAAWRGFRGGGSVRDSWFTPDFNSPDNGFRPVLELPAPDALAPGALKTVELNLNGGSVGGVEGPLKLVYTEGNLIAPSAEGLTRPVNAPGTYFKWADAAGNLYDPGADVPGTVTALTAQWDNEQFPDLTPGGTYWFDLSGVEIPGEINSSLPDGTRHYVPFTYTGTIDAYVLKSRPLGETDRGDSQTAADTTDSANPIGHRYEHSLFIADYAVSTNVSWNNLNAKSLIFNKDYESGGVNYTLRAPSAGSNFTGEEVTESERGTPGSNEWDAILNKCNQLHDDDTSGYLKNWKFISYDWGQDTYAENASARAIRGYSSARRCNYYSPGFRNAYVGFRPVLELPAPDTLTSELKTVSLDLNGGSVGGVEGTLNLVYTENNLIAPPAEGLARPANVPGTYFKWMDAAGNLYVPGEDVPDTVTTLTAQWSVAEQFPTLTPGGTYWFDLSGVEIPGEINPSLPDGTRHYVPFTYTGTIDAYVLKSRPLGETDRGDSQTAADTTDSANPIGHRYEHSLFISDYTVSTHMSWADLDSKSMIFGTGYSSGGVNYTLRAPSAGSDYTGETDTESERGTPGSNEWDAILDKCNQPYNDDTDGYIKNWSQAGNWGQDTSAQFASDRVVRGYRSARFCFWFWATSLDVLHGFRPVLELPSPDELASGGALKTVELNLNGGSVGGVEGLLNIVYSGNHFIAPPAEGLTRPANAPGTYFKWLDAASGTLYDPGDEVSSTVTALTARWAKTYTITVDHASLNFGSVSAGYAAPAQQTVTVKNEGNQSVTLQAPTGQTGRFTVGALSANTLAPGGTATFTVQPVTGLAAGTYQNTITVATDQGTSAAVSVTFTVQSSGSPSGGSDDDDDGPSVPNTERQIEQAAKQAKEGDTVKVELPSNGILSKETIESIAGKDVTLEVSTDSGITWIINGKDIPTNISLADLNLGIAMNTKTIPVTVINQVTGAVETIQITLDHSGPFGFTMTIRAPLGRENHGLWANLYHLNEETKQLEYQSAARIEANGDAELPLSHASSYAVVIDEKSHAEPFADVAESDWYYEAVCYVYRQGLMQGTSATAFSPNGTVTRAQAWTVLARMAGADTTGGNPWYLPAQAWAMEHGVSDGTNPDEPVTREQLVTMLWRSAGSPAPAGTLAGFTDADDIADFAQDAMAWAVGEGIVNGTSAATIGPKTGASRAQLAQILTNRFEK